MRRCVGVTAFRHTGPRNKFIAEVRGRNCLNLVTIGHSILTHGPGEVQRNGPPHYGAWGRWGLQMNSKWTKLAAAGALTLCIAAPALAGSVTQPGETVGLNAGAPLPQGWYAINTVDWGCMEHNPAAHMYGSHHSGCRLVNAVDDFGRKTTVAGGVAWGGSRRATQPTLRSRHLL
jgi:hypothetical protein